MECQNNNSCGAGKGDKPRNCFSDKYRNNYDLINWEKNNKTKYPIFNLDNDNDNEIMDKNIK